jgi:uncharacterized membrane protein YeaQ/YmgE (transglycosylase-associated protein family)
MSLLWFIIIGAVAGWIAGELTRGSGFGLLGNIIVGILGALLGGFLFDLFNVSTYGLVGNLVMSVIGAVVLLFLLSLFGARTGRTDLGRNDLL